MKAVGLTVPGLFAKSGLQCGCRSVFHTWGVSKGELAKMLSLGFLSNGNLAPELMLCAGICVHVCVSVCLVTLGAISQIQTHLTVGLEI